MINIVKLLKYKSENDGQTFFKETILINFISIAICFFFIYAVNNYFLEHLYGKYIMFFGGVLELCLLIFFVKKKISYSLTVNCGIFISTVCLASDVYFTGGLYSPSLPWVMLIPMISFLLLEKSNANRIWLFTGISIMFFYGVSGLFGLKFPNRIGAEELPIALITSYIGLSAMLVIVTYIFEKKKNKIFVELKESETRFRIMFEKAPLGIGLTNSITGVIDELNPKYAEIVGRDLAKMNNLDWMSITHPDDIQEDLDNMAKMNAGEIPGFKMAKRYIRPDGSVVWVDVAITPIDSEDKSNPRHLCMIEDITERINAEKVLKTKEQNSLLVRHASQVPGVIYQFQYFPDESFAFPFVSEGVLDLFEITAAEVMTNPYKLLDCVHRDDIDGLMSSINYSMKTLSNWVYDCRVDLKTKGVRWFRGNSKPELLEDGSIICHGYISDITERKKLEEQEIARNKELLLQQNILLDLNRIPSDLEFHDKLKIILEKTAKTIHCERVSIWILDGDKLSSDFIYKLSTNDFLPGSSIEEQHRPNYFSEIIKNKNIVANNVYTNSAVSEFEAYFKEEGIISLLDIPIRKNNNTIGVISYEHVGIERKWTNSEQAFARSISDIIALTFESEKLKIAKDKLRLNEERWKFAIEGSNDGMWDWDIKTSEVYRSPRWAEMLGFDPEEITTHIDEWTKRIHPDDVEWVNEELQKHLRHETSTYMTEHRILCKDGTYKWIMHRGKVIIWNEIGEPLRMVGTKTDIENRKKAEEELRQKEEKLKAIFTGSNDAIMLLTGQGFFDCNPKTLEMFNLKSVDEFSKIHPSDISPEFQPDGRNSFEKANEMIGIAFEKGINRFEWLHKRMNGEPFPAEVLLSAFDYGNERVLQATVIDITQRKIAAMQLQMQKEFYESILNNVPTEIVVFDTDHKYIFVNPTAIKNPEYRQYIIGKDDFEYYKYRNKDESIAKALRDRFLEVKTFGKVKEWEDTIFGENGQNYTYLRGMVPIYNQAGELKQVIGYGFDITHRKQIEYSLEQSEERLRLVLAGTNDGWWDWDLIENKLFYSPRWWAMFGYLDNEIDLTPSIYPNIVHPEDKERVEKIFTESLANGTTSYEIECRLLDKKGNYIPILSRGYILRNADNIPIRVSGSDMDLTERKRADEQLKQSEEKYRSLIENSPEIILIADSDENIQFINFASGKYDRDEIIGHSLYCFVDPKHHDMIRKAHQNIFNGGKSESYETEGTNVDGSRSWFLTHVGPKYLDEEVIGLVLFIRNITDRKNSEEHIKQSLNEKEVLLKEVHHRVKNNLQIISSILNLQSSTISDKQTLDLLKNSQDRIRSMSLIHELLYQTKDFSTINFSEYIRSIATNLFQSYTQNKMIELKLDVDIVFLDLDLAIPCGLIINELITNSLKYGFTALEQGEVKITLKKEGNIVNLQIGDNGKGFPSNIDFRDTESLGMQLVISLIEQIDGTIELDNTQGAKYDIHFKTQIKNLESI